MQKRYPLRFQLDRPYRAGGRLSRMTKATVNITAPTNNASHTAPYSVIWNNAAAGTYSLTAKATTNLNLITTTPATSIVIKASPTVALSTPANNASFTANPTISINATATPNTGQTIAQVEFIANTVPATTPLLIGTDSSAPYSVSWSGMAGGSYSLTAKATDNLGGSKTSAARMITVANPVIQTYYIHTDHLNTPRLITNSANAKVWEWNNDDPFANNVPNENPSALGTFVYNPRLPGQYFDKETGAFYNYYRDNYFTDSGRYGQSDPIGLAGGINTYAYVGGNPVSFTDPEGLMGSRGYVKGQSQPLIAKVFGCVLGCLSSQVSNNSTLGAGLEATLGGGIEICEAPKPKAEENSCKVPKPKYCGIYDPNCDNQIDPPSLPLPKRFGVGAFIGVSVKPDGRVCYRFGVFGEVPFMPSLDLGNAYEK